VAAGSVTRNGVRNFSRKAMRVRPRGSVLRAMPGFFTPALPLALSLLAGVDDTAPDITELPRANGPMFRARIATRPWLAPGPAAGASAPNTGAPAALPRISSRFGPRADPFHRAARMHHGIDIPGRAGTPVYAAEDGVVRFAGRAGGYGNLIEIVHPGGARTRYGHLAAILVPAGTQVARGEAIARMGSTGRSTASHLHFELRTNGRAVDPLPYLGGAAPARERAVTTPTAPHVSAFALARGQTKDNGPVP